MRVAQIATAWETVPPKNMGGRRTGGKPAYESIRHARASGYTLCNQMFSN
jgi:hypothetical protein